jgi:hypothetical protein
MGETDRVPTGGRAMQVVDVSAGERSSESGVQHFEPPLASQVLLGIKQLSRPARCSCADPIAYAVIPVLLVSGVCHPRIETPAGPKKGQCLLRGRRGDPFSARATS